MEGGKRKALSKTPNSEQAEAERRKECPKWKWWDGAYIPKCIRLLIWRVGGIDKQW